MWSFQNLTNFFMDCSYWNEIGNQNVESWVSLSDDNSSFSSMDINNSGFKMKRQEMRGLRGGGKVQWCALHQAAPGFTLTASGARLAFAQNKISSLHGFVCENSAVWKLTKIFKLP